MYPYYKDTALKRHLFVLKLETSTEVMTSEDGGSLHTTIQLFDQYPN